MKKFILLLILCCPTVGGISEGRILVNDIIKNTIEDGWYTSTVRYNNFSTVFMATYTLNVKVEYDRVVSIEFPKGGFIHTGYNNEGYIYSGGTLYFEKDYSGSLKAATTKVTIFENDNTMRTFDIRIQ